MGSWPNVGPVPKVPPYTQVMWPGWASGDQLWKGIHLAHECMCESILDDFPNRKLKAVLGQTLLVLILEIPTVLSTLTT